MMVDNVCDRLPTRVPRNNCEDAQFDSETDESLARTVPASFPKWGAHCSIFASPSGHHRIVTAIITAIIIAIAAHTFLSNQQNRIHHEGHPRRHPNRRHGICQWHFIDHPPTQSHLVDHDDDHDDDVHP